MEGDVDEFPKGTVFFVKGERREASKLRLAAAKLFLSPAPDV